MKFDLLRKKNIFPYSYLTDETGVSHSLPPQKKCYDVLYNKEMSDEDYNRMKYAYEFLDCENMEDYCRLYLKTDCVLLFDAFEFYRRTNMEKEGLDPVFYISLPQLSYDSMLKTTKVELELFPPDQADMHTMINTSRRGGLTMCPHRYAVANNKYMKNYNPKLLSSFIMY